MPISAPGHGLLKGQGSTHALIDSCSPSPGSGLAVHSDAHKTPLAWPAVCERRRLCAASSKPCPVALSSSVTFGSDSSLAGLALLTWPGVCQDFHLCHCHFRMLPPGCPVVGPQPRSPEHRQVAPVLEQPHTFLKKRQLLPGPEQPLTHTWPSRCPPGSQESRLVLCVF